MGLMLTTAARGMTLPDPDVTNTFPNLLGLAIDRVGLHFLHPETGVCVATFPYQMIYRWSGSFVDLSLVVYNKRQSNTEDLSFYTYQSQEIGAAIVHYINAAMSPSTG